MKKVSSNTKKKTISGGAKGKSKDFRLIQNLIQNQINNNEKNNDDSPELDHHYFSHYNNSYDEQRLNRYKKKHNKKIKNYLKPIDFSSFNNDNYCDALIYDGDTLEEYQYILSYDNSMSKNDKMHIAGNIINILNHCRDYKQIIIKKAEEDVENLESMINSFENLVYKLEGPSERINGESGVWSLPIKSSIPLSNYLPPNTYNSNYPKLVKKN